MIKWLTSPESQADAHYWASVFAGHMVIGMALWMLTGTVWLYFVWELIQLAFFKAEVWDSILDLVAATLGAMVAAAIWANDAQQVFLLSFVALCVAIAGILKREASLRSNPSRRPRR